MCQLCANSTEVNSTTRRNSCELGYVLSGLRAVMQILLHVCK